MKTIYYTKVEITFWENILQNHLNLYIDKS